METEIAVRKKGNDEHKHRNELLKNGVRETLLLKKKFFLPDS